MFFRIFRDDKEILLNSTLIWKIEVEYAIQENKTLYEVGLKWAYEDPNAKRTYTVFVGSEIIKVAADPGNPILKLIEDIYKNALKT